MRQLEKAEHARSSGEKSDRSGHQTMDSGIMAEKRILFIGLGYSKLGRNESGSQENSK